MALYHNYHFIQSYLAPSLYSLPLYAISLCTITLHISEKSRFHLAHLEFRFNFECRLGVGAASQGYRKSTHSAPARDRGVGDSCHVCFVVLAGVCVCVLLCWMVFVYVLWSWLMSLCVLCSVDFRECFGLFVGNVCVFCVKWCVCVCFTTCCSWD